MRLFDSHAHYDDEKFDIKLSYETCGKLIKEGSVRNFL